MLPPSCGVVEKRREGGVSVAATVVWSGRGAARAGVRVYGRGVRVLGDVCGRQVWI